MTGVVDIQSHYYENGNVQMSVHKELSPLSITLDDKAAVKVIQEISSFEDSLQTHLKEVFSSMQKDALKVLFVQLLYHIRILDDNFLVLVNISNGM